MNMTETIDAAPVVGILIPKTASGYFTGIGFKSYLASRGLNNVEVIEVQPCQIKRVEIPEAITILYVGGLGMKNCPPKDLNGFIKKYQDIIAFWADNHPAHEEIEEMTTGDRKLLYFDALDDRAPSCVALLNHLWGDKIVKPEWVAVANHLENPAKYPTNGLADQYKTLMYVAKVEDESGHGHCYTDEVKDLYAKYLLPGGANWAEISRLLKKFNKIKTATAQAQKNIMPLHPELQGAFVTRPSEEEQVEKDTILKTIKQKYPKHLVAIQHHNLRGEPVTTILSSQENILLAFADYRNGTKETDRIFIPGDHQEVLDQITDRLIQANFKIESN